MVAQCLPHWVAMVTLCLMVCPCKCCHFHLASCEDMLLVPQGSPCPIMATADLTKAQPGAQLPLLAHRVRPDSVLPLSSASMSTLGCKGAELRTRQHFAVRVAGGMGPLGLEVHGMVPCLICLSCLMLLPQLLGAFCPAVCYHTLHALGETQGLKVFLRESCTFLHLNYPNPTVNVISDGQNC